MPTLNKSGLILVNEQKPRLKIFYIIPEFRVSYIKILLNTQIRICSQNLMKIYYLDTQSIIIKIKS